MTSPPPQKKKPSIIFGKSGMTLGPHPSQLSRIFSGIFRDPQKWDPLSILFPYHSHFRIPKDMGMVWVPLVWVLLTTRGFHMSLGVPNKSPLIYLQGKGCLFKGEGKTSREILKVTHPR